MDIIKENFESNFTQEELWDVKTLNSLSRIEGKLLEYLQIDNIQYWSVKDKYLRLQVGHDSLPSDQRFWEDYLWMLYRRNDYADSWKFALEDQYRKDW